MISGFLKIESYRKGIFFSTLFNIGAKALIFGTNLIIAFYFGTQAKTDVYFYCMATIVLIAGYVTGIDGAVLIPESMRLSAQESRKKAVEFLNFFLYAYVLLGILCTLLLLIDPYRIFLFISNFDRSALLGHSNIIFFSLPLLLFMIVNTYLIDILAAYRYFTMPMISSMVNSVVSLLFLVLFHASLDITSLLLGLLAASALQLAFLLRLMKTSLQWDFSFSFAFPDRKNVKNILFAASGNTATFFSSYVPLFILSGFNPGVITALNYGQQVSNIPTGLITNQFSSVAGIKFNELNARQEGDEMNRVFLMSARFLLFVLVPVSFFMALFSTEIITLLYRRGAFDASSVAASALFLRYFALLPPLYAVNTLVSRLFIARQKIMQVFWYQIVFNAALIALMFGTIRSLGVVGYPVALIALHGVNILFCYVLLKLLVPAVRYGEMLRYLALVIVLNSVLFVFAYAVKRFFLPLHPAATMSLGFLAYAGGLLLVNRVFRLNEELHGLFVKMKNIAPGTTGTKP